MVLEGGKTTSRSIGKITGAVLLATVFVLSAFAVASFGSAGGKPMPTPPDWEQKFRDALSYDYAWQVTSHMLYGGEVVAGTDSSAEAANWIAGQMKRIGLSPGGSSGSFIEDFQIYGWEDLGSSVTVVSPETKSIKFHQAYKDVGTGPDGITAPVVYINLARWDDFERNDVTGKIVLFHRQDPMFYCLPSLAEAKARGAVGALMDYPILDDADLKTDVIGVSIPAVYITELDSNYIQGMLSAGQEVVVKLVVNNKVGHYPMAHNVVGVIKGSVYPEEFVYLTAHFDHWFTSACDDDAGIGSLLAIAKAMKAIGIKPDRTLVFVAFDSEELGGQPDTWYDWCLGSYSHIVASLDGGPALHPDRPGKIAAMLNMDVIGVRDAVVFVETTPDITNFIRSAARDSGLTVTAPTYVYWPPSSYDDWPFYMAGVPVMQIAWWGPYYDTLYHTTGDTLDKIDPEHLQVNMIFNGLCMLRMSQSKVLPYTLTENLEVAYEGIDYLLMNDPTALDAGKADISSLMDGLETYEAVLCDIKPTLESTILTVSETGRVNKILMQSEKELLPHMFDWDCSVIPGWTGLWLFETYANDLNWMNQAIESLEAGKVSAAAGNLGSVTTMEWGQYVGEEAYQHVLDEIAFPEHPLWADGFLPTLTQVHIEYMVLMGTWDGSPMSTEMVLDSLIEKRDAIYGYVTMAALEAGMAFEEAAGILGQI